jgi:hypothetical protein
MKKKEMEKNEKNTSFADCHITSTRQSNILLSAKPEALGELR